MNNMELQEFIEKFADLFDETDASEFEGSTPFKELDEWSSMMGLAIIAMVKSQCGKTITGKEIRECETVGDLYNLVAAK